MPDLTIHKATVILDRADGGAVRFYKVVSDGGVVREVDMDPAAFVALINEAAQIQAARPAPE